MKWTGVGEHSIEREAESGEPHEGGRKGMFRGNRTARRRVARTLKALESFSGTRKGQLGEQSAKICRVWSTQLVSVLE